MQLLILVAVDYMILFAVSFATHNSASTEHNQPILRGRRARRAGTPSVRPRLRLFVEGRPGLSRSPSARL